MHALEGSRALSFLHLIFLKGAEKSIHWSNFPLVRRAE
jgi:hypothetical protein